MVSKFLAPLYYTVMKFLPSLRCSTKFIL